MKIQFRQNNITIHSVKQSSLAMTKQKPMKTRISISTSFFLGVMLVLINGCKEDDVSVMLTTYNMTDISITTAKSGGNITSDGGEPVIERGVCWSTGSMPTVNDSKTTDGAGIGIFSSSITNLTANTTYYLRAYATNSAGIFYGREVNFTTYAIQDIDGNLYHSINIEKQEWMQENLKTTKFSDGSKIQNVTQTSEWINLSLGAYCDYDNNPSNVATFGRLYNGYTVTDQRNVCPSGWHVPSLDEWDILINNLGGVNIAGGKMKSIGTAQNGDGFWNSPNTGATNESGFTGLPGGTRFDLGDFRDIKSFGHWLSSDSRFGYTWSIRLQDNHTMVEKYNNYSHIGHSIRCVKD